MGEGAKPTERRARRGDDTGQKRKWDEDEKKERKNHSVKTPETARDSCKKVEGGRGGGRRRN